MRHDAARPFGLRLTLRHQMIVIVYCALMFTLADGIRKRGGSDALGAMVASGLLLSPWILGILVMVLDRPGPLRNWTVSSLFMLFSPALAIYHDWVSAIQVWRTGSLSSPILTVFLNVFFLGSYAVYWRAMGPHTCPTCGRWALIPLMQLWGQTRRTEKTRWCASCGGLFWRLPRGTWQKERRRTWLDDKPFDPLAALDVERATPVAEGCAGGPVDLSKPVPAASSEQSVLGESDNNPPAVAVAIAETSESRG